MTDREVRRTLNEFVRVGNALHAEAKRRYGREGMLFHEADGGVHIMDGDSSVILDRQKHVRETADGQANWGQGAW